uniref:Dol-P-Glc:Glc(2)Man(9)GlcNAc(2)-PP-Dol alpha-1,2-glucosyltransferase n=1 Tax=Strigamia maritima TaxID=126957 RepID=T1IQU4_STRMM
MMAAINWKSRLLFTVTLIIFSILSGWLFLFFHKHQPTPYMDETFHIPQAQKYCDGKFQEWNSKITTLPGLYLISVGFLRPINFLTGINFCDVFNLRLTNLFFSIGNLYLLYGLINKLHGTNKDFSALKSCLVPLNLALLPVLYFFTFLYYTDVASTFFVLLMYLFHLHNHPNMSAVIGLLAVIIRQTNIIWVAFLALQTGFNAIVPHLRIDKKENRMDIKTTPRYLTIIIRNLFSIFAHHRKRVPYLCRELLESCAGYIFVGVIFLFFVHQNKGIVVGDRDAHQVVLHVPQVLYFLAFTLFFGCSYFVTPQKITSFMRAVRNKPVVYVAFVLAALLAVAFNVHEHPYLLADNRHYTFYVWKKIFNMHKLARYAFIPVYLYALWAVIQALRYRDAVWKLGFFVAVAALVVPQKLLEWRYFILPYIFLRLNMQIETYAKLIIEFVLYMIIFFKEKGSLKGCFKHETQMIKSNSVVASTSIDKCVEACIQVYHMYAALQEAKNCFCGAKYNSLESSENCTLECSANRTQICGGVESDSVYATGLMIPSPVMNLVNTSATDTSIQIRWSLPENINGGVKMFKLTAQILSTFDKNSDEITPKEWMFPNTTFKGSINGLIPATKYNLSIQPLNDFGDGPFTTGVYWTEVGTPPIPPAPDILSRNNSQLMSIKLPLIELNTGPVSNYVIIVYDESRFEPLDAKKLTNVTEATKHKVPYYVAAELSPNEAAMPFVVGDGGTYNGFLNAPLPDDKTYTVIVGVVSSLNGITRASYSKPAVYRAIFNNHKPGILEMTTFHPLGHPPTNSKPNALVIGLSVAIAIGILLLIGCVVVFLLMRWRVKRNNRASDHQELTVHQTSEAASDNLGIASSVLSINDETDINETFENIKSRMQMIQRSHLELADRVLGDGKFGVIRHGIAHRNGEQTPVVVHTLPSFSALTDSDKRLFVMELDAMSDMGVHANTVAVLGLAEEVSQLHVVVEHHQVMLKDILLESRALDYYPVFAEKNCKFSTFKEEQLVEFALGIAQGMAHLAQTKIVHGRLCSWHVRIEGNIPKVTHFGLAQYEDHSEKIDYQRWSSLEALRGRYTIKGDVWSFAVLFWEIVTLGATPYGTVKCKEVSGRVTRGMRLKQPNYLGDDVYQLMLQCWQIDSDERPTFSEIVSQLVNVLSNDFVNMGHLCLDLCPGFQYEKYEMELEKTILPNGGVQV